MTCVSPGSDILHYEAPSCGATIKRPSRAERPGRLKYWKESYVQNQ
jgi:hypothetical protein